MPFKLTRRRFVQATAAGIMTMPFYNRASTANAAAPTDIPLLSRHLFFRDPDRSSVRLSPDGKQISWREPRDGVLNLMVAPTDDPSQARQITHAKDRSVAGYFTWAWTNKHIVFFDTAGDENNRAYSVDIDSGETKALTPGGGVKSYVKQRARHFPEELLFGMNARDRKLFDLVRINVVTGESQPVFQNPGFSGVLTGTDFAVHFGGRFLPNGSVDVQKWEPDGSWSEFLKIEPEDVAMTRLDGISADKRSAFLLTTRGRNTAALMEIDIATRENRVLAEDPDADITDILYDPNTARPFAAVSVADRPRWHLIEPAFAFDLDHLRAARGDGEFLVQSMSNEGGRIVAAYYSSNTAAEFRRYDRNDNSFKPLFKSRNDLDNITLRPMLSVAIPASDGVTLPGYLTLPADNAKNVPLVLAIHGGPYARDFWGYSGLHQWLANRGYGVLSVNYRGSTGFGKTFINIADQGWGGRMQDDLTDAVAWALTQGYADPKRIGFFGASYGGYAGLIAATKTPETFACIVDMFGPSDLVALMHNIPPYWNSWFSDWKRRLADPDTEAGRQWLTERSPLTHVDKIVRPLLIAQGLRDVRVQAMESEQIVQALEPRHVTVTYVTFPDEGHGFVRQENNIAFTAVAEAFLGQHLGGRVEPVGDAFSGSSIRFEAGRNLIPGIG